ncbi:MAG: ribosome biogenesis GTPase Der [Alphaproteobacteria bacterium]
MARAESDRSPVNFTVVIVGRPNVGKSTLFNRLTGRRTAIVHDTPGVTRDRREGQGKFADLSFRVIDTAGLERSDSEASLQRRMLTQTMQALDEADLALFVVDARAGITNEDEHFAKALRRSKAKLLLLANKCEGKAGEAGRLEAFNLGLGEPIGLSAEHGEGMSELYDAIAAAMADRGFLPYDENAPSAVTAADDDTDEAAWLKRPLNLAVVGRPNAGKSTLINRLLGQDRVITGPEPGLTRDAIAIDWSWGGREIRLIDTAGIRRRAKVADELERMSVADTDRAVQFADVVVLMIDANSVQDFGYGIEKQDLTIAKQVIDEGRALVIAANKWDKVTNPNKLRNLIAESLDQSLAQARGVPMITMSALEGTQLDRLMKEVLRIERVWSSRVGTGALNRWLRAAMEANPPPLVNGRRLKIRYMTQVKSRPPTFALFCNLPQDMPEMYLRYLTNGMRADFGLEGVPIRTIMRGGENPFSDD